MKNKQRYERYEFLHLYDPRKEGLASYDINYVNALRKSRRIKDEKKKCINKNEGCAA